MFEFNLCGRCRLWCGRRRAHCSVLGVLLQRARYHSCLPVGIFQESMVQPLPNILDMCPETLKEFLSKTDAYLVKNGKLVQPENVKPGDSVQLVPRLRGGKGGFGSMLRAIGAQIEKTTNREACRDLSGRRLRDINEEQRLKNWIEKQAERQKEAEDAKQAKLEKLRRKPKHVFEDKGYMDQKEKQQDNLFEAVEAGTSTVISTENDKSTSLKRSTDDSEGDGVQKKRLKTEANPTVKRKKNLWIDPDLPDDSDLSDGSESGDDEKAAVCN